MRVICPTVPTILLPFKITVKGAPSGRVCDGAQTAPPLTLIFYGKPIGTYQVGRERALSSLQATANLDAMSGRQNIWAAQTARHVASISYTRVFRSPGAMVTITRSGVPSCA